MEIKTADFGPNSLHFKHFNAHAVHSHIDQAAWLSRALIAQDQVAVKGSSTTAEIMIISRLWSLSAEKTNL